MQGDKGGSDPDPTREPRATDQKPTQPNLNQLAARPHATELNLNQLATKPHAIRCEVEPT